jgi:predicted ArsR family transcriptional regulator
MTSEHAGGTRERILVLLRRHGRLSAPRLAELLQLTSVGVRRHLALLERDALAEVLNEQGFMAEVEPADGGLRLCQHNCTVEHLATELPDLCASEAELFERLLGTRVERETTIVDGAVRCQTRIDLGARGTHAPKRTTPSPNRKAARSPA